MVKFAGYELAVCVASLLAAIALVMLVSLPDATAISLLLTATLILRSSTKVDVLHAIIGVINALMVYLFAYVINDIMMTGLIKFAVIVGGAVLTLLVVDHLIKRATDTP